MFHARVKLRPWSQCCCSERTPNHHRWRQPFWLKKVGKRPGRPQARGRMLYFAWNGITQHGARRTLQVPCARIHVHAGSCRQVYIARQAQSCTGTERSECNEWQRPGVAAWLHAHAQGHSLQHNCSVRNNGGRTWGEVPSASSVRDGHSNWATEYAWTPGLVPLHCMHASAWPAHLRSLQQRMAGNMHAHIMGAVMTAC